MPLRAVDLGQRMTALSAISKRVDAFRKLLEIRESHRNVEPVQYMVSMWHNLLMDRPQTGIAIGEDRDRSGLVDSASPQGQADGANRLGASVAHKSKACGTPVAVQRLAGDDFKVSFRSLVSIPDLLSPSKPTINSLQGPLNVAALRSSADF